MLAQGHSASSSAWKLLASSGNRGGPAEDSGTEGRTPTADPSPGAHPTAGG